MLLFIHWELIERYCCTFVDVYVSMHVHRLCACLQAYLHACVWVCLCVCVHTKRTCVNSVSAVAVLPDTLENPRCRLDLFTSAALSNQVCLQTTWPLSDRRTENPLVTKSVSLGSVASDLSRDIKAIWFQIIWMVGGVLDFTALTLQQPQKWAFPLRNPEVQQSLCLPNFKSIQKCTLAAILPGSVPH